MSESNFTKNITTNIYNYKLLKHTVMKHNSHFGPLQKIGYYLLIFLLIFFILILIAILALLIRRQILKFLEKMRRIKLQNEINKIMMIDIFETRSPSLDSGNSDFHSINNDSTLSDISNSSGNVLSEINIHNDVHNSKDSNDI